MSDSVENAPQPRSLTDLMLADPLSLTNSDIDEIIRNMREKRAQWQAGIKPARKAPGAAPAKLTAKEQKVKGLNLDLDI